jgi:cytochrome c biogenesis protein ResB
VCNLIVKSQGLQERCFFLCVASLALPTLFFFYLLFGSVFGSFAFVAILAFLLVIQIMCTWWAFEKEEMLQEKETTLQQGNNAYNDLKLLSNKAPFIEEKNSCKARPLTSLYTKYIFPIC